MAEWPRVPALRVARSLPVAAEGTLDEARPQGGPQMQGVPEAVHGDGRDRLRTQSHSAQPVAPRYQATLSVPKGLERLSAPQAGWRVPSERLAHGAAHPSGARAAPRQLAGDAPARELASAS